MLCGVEAMKRIQVELPEKLAQASENLVKEGWFRDASEAVRFALTEFLNGCCLQLLEQFQWEDIAWALQQKATE